jgi:acetyltransferase-like isoleucine patch superfamily enzyme
LFRWIASRLLDLLLRPRGLHAAGSRVRMAFPRRLRGRAHLSLGSGTRVGAHGWIEAITRYGGQRFTPQIVIGRDVAIGRHLTLTATHRVEIGDGCLLSEGVYVSDTAHDVIGFSEQPLPQRGLVFKGAVSIGPRCFLGYRACVLPGVTLGEGCVVGAHAVVTHSFGPGSVVAGVPARLVRTIERT